MNHLILRRKRLLLACFLWAVLLSVLAMQPLSIVKLFFPSPAARSFAHVLFYGVLAFLFCLYFRFKRNLGKIPIGNYRLVILSFFLTAALGGATEVMQLLTPDRMADLNDLYFDMAGAGIGIACFYLFRGLL